MEDEDDEIQDQDDILGLPEYVCKKRQIADALHRVVITKYLTISNKNILTYLNLKLDEILFNIKYFTIIISNTLVRCTFYLYFNILTKLTHFKIGYSSVYK